MMKVLDASTKPGQPPLAAQATTALRNSPIGAHDPNEVSEFFEHLRAYCDTGVSAIGIGPLDFRWSLGKGDVRDLIDALIRVNDPDNSKFAAQIEDLLTSELIDEKR